MKPSRVTFRSAAVCALMSVAVATFGATQSAEVIVVVSLTDAGKKIAPPSPEKPAYYFPITVGWMEEGKVVAKEKAMDGKDLTPQFAKALAREGYLLCHPYAGQPPTLLFEASWGCLNPDRYNRAQMLDLVAGNSGIPEVAKTIRNLDPRGEYPEFVRRTMDAAGEDRFFIIIDAFDFAAAMRKERVLLWRACMSARRQGVSFDDVAPVMIASGVPQFGRQTNSPQFTTKPLREGRVEIGPPEVIEYLEPQKEPEPAKAAPAPEKPDAAKPR